VRPHHAAADAYDHDDVAADDPSDVAADDDHRHDPSDGPASDHGRPSDHAASATG
jgi:hypothetical protein